MGGKEEGEQVIFFFLCLIVRFLVMGWVHGGRGAGVLRIFHESPHRTAREKRCAVSRLTCFCVWFGFFKGTQHHYVFSFTLSYTYIYIYVTSGSSSGSSRRPACGPVARWPGVGIGEKKIFFE